MNAKRIIALAALLLILVFVVLYASQPPSINEDEYESVSQGSLEVHFFGIGRADAILIATSNHAIMIDTGENRHGAYLVKHLQNFGIEFLDYLIITHFDSDHVGGAHTIIDNIPIGLVIIPNYSRESRHVERFENAVQNAGLTPYTLINPLAITLDDAYFIFDPSELPYIHFPRIDDGDYNYDAIHDNDMADGVFIPTGDDFSIIVSVSHGDNHFLFTGDAMNHRLEELMQNDVLMALDYNFLKVPRHGRHTRSAVELILSTQPCFAVITGFHPDDLHIYYSERPTDRRIIEALEYVGANTFFTMSEGVSFHSDGVLIIKTPLPILASPKNLYR